MYRRAALAVCVILWPLGVLASGHGPVFGMTTPTNAAGAWAVVTCMIGFFTAYVVGPMLMRVE